MTSFRTTSNSHNFDSDLSDEALRGFCRHDVLEPWEQVLRANRGEAVSGWLRPMMALGPPVAMHWVPRLIPPLAVRTLLGEDCNLLTVVTDRRRQRIVFVGAERTEQGRYVEMLRLDNRLQRDQLIALSRSVAAGREDQALTQVRRWLGELGLGAFRPGVVKVADLLFFDAFAGLAQVRRHGTPAQWWMAAGGVAHRVLSERLLYFYPRVPAERLLALGRIGAVRLGR